MIRNNYTPTGLPRPPPLTIEGSPEAGVWSPRRGLIRAAFWGLLTASFLAGVTVPVAYYSPLILTNFLIRTFLAFFLAWLLFATVQRAAGMIGNACTALALTFTGLVLVSHLVVFGLYGVPNRDGTLLIGLAMWLSPVSLLLFVGIPLLLGGGACALFCHRHGASPSFLVEVFSHRIFGGNG